MYTYGTKGKKCARGDAAMTQRGEGAGGGRVTEAFLPADTSTAHAARVAAAAETALILTIQSGLLVSWTEAAELQRASLALCAACRWCIPVRVRVAASTPRAMWACVSRNGRVIEKKGSKWGRNDDCDHVGRTSGDAKTAKRRRRQQRQQHHQDRHEQQPGKADSRCSSGGNGAGGAQLPRLRISSILWEAPASHLGDGGDLPSDVTELTFGRDFNRPLSGLAWPPKLERLTFGSKFNRDLVGSEDRSGVGRRAATGAAAAAGGIGREEKKSETGLLCYLPWSLKELAFGKQFNKPLPRTLLPPGLISLTLGRNFRHRGSVRDVVWPVGVKVVRFGEAMLKRERRDWPRLEAMRGVAFSNGPNGTAAAAAATAGFAWPAGLDRVEFWQEGRAVVSLKGGKTLEGDSLEWLTNH